MSTIFKKSHIHSQSNFTVKLGSLGHCTAWHTCHPQ